MLDAHISNLFSSLRQALGVRSDVPGLDTLLTALESRNFYFDREQWHNVEACLQDRVTSATCEFLLRATDSAGRLIPHESLIRAISLEGLQGPFDTAIALSAMDQAVRDNTFPISINISAHAAGDPFFWEDLHGQMQHFFKGRYDPHQVTFELTEDGPADQVAGAALDHMKELGYSFALDDLSHTDLRRLKNLGSFVNMVKIDGKSLEADERKEFSLREFIDEIRHHARDAAILVEWVKTPEQARKLHHRFNVNFVSGWSLESNTQQFGHQIRQVVGHEKRSLAPIPA